MNKTEIIQKVEVSALIIFGGQCVIHHNQVKDVVKALIKTIEDNFIVQDTLTLYELIGLEERIKTTMSKYGAITK